MCSQGTVQRGVTAVVAAALVATACGHEQSAAEKLANSVHDQAASLCHPQYHRLSSEPGDWAHDSVPAKALAFKVFENDQSFPPTYVSIPSSVEATTEADLHSLVCQFNYANEEGTYTNGGGNAERINSDVTIVSWPDGKVLAQQHFTGEPPPTRASGTLGAEGPEATHDIDAWLQTVVK